MKLGSLETLIDQGGDCEDIKKKKKLGRRLEQSEKLETFNKE